MARGPMDFDATVRMLLDSSPTRLVSFAEFREACGASANASEAEDRFCHLMATNDLFLVDDSLLDWCGYQGDPRTKRATFKRMLVGNHILFNEAVMGKQKLNIYMTPNCFTEALMLMTSPRSIDIRRVMCEHKKLCDGYAEYETKFYNSRIDQLHHDFCLSQSEKEEAVAHGRRAEQQARRNVAVAGAFLGSLETVTAELENATANATVQPVDPKLRSALALFLIAEEPVEEELDDDDSQEASLSQNGNVFYTVHTYRGQAGKLANALQKVKDAHPRAVVSTLKEFIPEPNGSNLYIRVKAFFRGRGTGVFIHRNTIALGASVTPAEFLDIVVALRSENTEAAVRATNLLAQRHAEYSELTR